MLTLLCTTGERHAQKIQEVVVLKIILVILSRTWWLKNRWNRSRKLTPVGRESCGRDIVTDVTSMVASIEIKVKAIC